MRQCVLILPLVLLLGCPPSPGPGPNPPPRRRGKTGPTPDLTDANRVYRMASSLGAKALGKPEQVSLKGGVKAWTVLLQRTRWVLKHLEQSAVRALKRRTSYMKLPEAERLKHMDRVDDHVQLWWVDKKKVGDAAALKKALTPTSRPHLFHRELALMGSDDRAVWYAYAPIHVWLKLRETQGLKGGDAKIPALIRGLTVKDRHEATALGCYYLLAKVGLKAKAAVEELVRTKHPARERAVFALGRERGKEVLAWLLKMVKHPDPKVAFQARRRILYPPRKGAETLYVTWLREGAGKRSVWRELRAIRMLEIKAAAKWLLGAIQHPWSFAEWRTAYVLRRTFKGKPLPEALLKIKQRIIKASLASGDRKPDKDTIAYGVSRLLKAKDQDAAALLGLDLATFVSKGDYRAANAAGEKVLKKLRRRRGKIMVVQIYKGMRKSPDRTRLLKLFKRLQRR